MHCGTAPGDHTPLGQVHVALASPTRVYPVSHVKVTVTFRRVLAVDAVT